MRTRLIGSLAALLAGTSLATAQPWSGSKPGPVASGPGPAVSYSAAPTQPSATGSALPPPVWNKPDPDCDPVIKQDDLSTSLCEGRLWFSGSYLYWWVKPGPTRTPLVTTGVAGDPPGALDEADTRILFDDITYKPFNGARFAAGYAIDDFRQTSIEFGMFVLGGREDLFSLSSNDAGFPVISRPFFTTPPPVPFLFPGEDVHSVSRPGLFAGGIAIDGNSDIFGMELNLTRSWVDIGPFTVDVIMGARYLYLHEALTIRDQTTSIGGDLFLNGVFLDNGAGESNGISVSLFDQFKTTNHFYGGQIGLRGEYNCGCWYILGKAKVALGYVTSRVGVSGTTTATLTDGTQLQATGGLLALSSNIGVHEDSDFAVQPEAEVTVGFNLTENIRVFAGYNFLYISKVLRPGDVIDNQINPALLPTADSTAFGVPGGPANPGIRLDWTDFWAHGLHAGVAFHW